MVFIRPTILRSKEDAQKLTQQRYGYIRGMQLQRDPEAEPTIDELVRDYMGAAPPIAPPQPGDVMVQPQAGAQLEVIEPTVRESSGVVPSGRHSRERGPEMTIPIVFPTGLRLSKPLADLLDEKLPSTACLQQALRTGIDMLGANGGGRG